jgi:hypothetical protein
MFIVSFVPAKAFTGVPVALFPSDMASASVLGVTAVAHTREEIIEALMAHLRAAYPEVPPSELILSAKEQDYEDKPFTAISIRRKLLTSPHKDPTEYVGDAAITELALSPASA